MAMDGLQKAERKSPSLFSGELLLRGGCALMGCLLLLMGVFRIAWPRGGSPKAEMPSESKHRDRSSPVLPPSYRKGPLVLTSYCPLHTPANRSFQATASQLSAMATWTSWHGYELRPLTHDIDLDAPQGMSKCAHYTTVTIEGHCHSLLLLLLLLLLFSLSLFSSLLPCFRHPHGGYSALFW